MIEHRIRAPALALLLALPLALSALAAPGAAASAAPPAADPSGALNPEPVLPRAIVDLLGAPLADSADPVPGVPAPDDLTPDAPDAPDADEADEEARAALGGRIRESARKELADDRRNRERRSNCNYYSGALGVGTKCGDGWRRNLWCVDFLRWVWRDAGADVDGLTWRPAQLKEHGQRNGTWHAGRDLVGLAPGDALLWRLNRPGAVGHANIVVAVRGDDVITIGGNESGKIRRQTWSPQARATVSGYVSPVPGGR